MLFLFTLPVVSQPETDNLTITINDGTDAIAGASVTIGEDTETTDENGQVVFDLAYDDYTASITADGYEDATEEIAFRSNHKNFTISLTTSSNTEQGG